MKKSIFDYLSIVVFLGAVFLTSSCERDVDYGLEPVTHPLQNRQVSSIQAKAFASMMANNLFSSEENGAQLKSATANVNRSIEGLSAIVAESKDTVLFSVNFSDNKGFMLISGDKGDAPIVALSDSGAFDINNLNPTIEIWLKQQKELISAQMKELLDENEDEHSLWYGIANDTSQVEIEFVGNLPGLKSCPTGEIPSGRTTVYPYTGMVNKWGREPDITSMRLFEELWRDVLQWLLANYALTRCSQMTITMQGCLMNYPVIIIDKILFH